MKSYSTFRVLFFFLFIFCLVLAGTLWSYTGATIKEVPLTIPTYGVGQPDLNPRFYEGRIYQGAQGRIYPYPISDVLTNEKNDKTYNAVYLENEFIRICVLPEIGGRIFEALDKTNNYHFFYRQHVIKPSLIGMLGAWISGGVEWNFPHHHRANTFMPMSYELMENPDGSKTLWMTEIERRHRMKMLLGITIFPDRSYLEVTLKFFNRTPFVHSFLYFANPSVHVDSTYQVLFPPEAEYVTQHAKREFSEWPVSNSTYGGLKYNTVDISWWKNLPKPVSFFCWDHEADYFGGYYHGKEAGVAYIGNHHIAPGKKFFTFGCGDRGKMWDQMLTDTDGPYLELMAGAYSDNQPDYSWCQPYEVKIVNQYWFPIRNLQGLKYANLNGALNLEVNDQNIAIISLNTTREQKNARLIVKTGEQILYEQSTNITPALPFQQDISLPDNVKEQELSVLLESGNGEELLKYTPVQKPGNTRPEPVVPPAKPKKIKTNEELYFAGLRLNQFYNAKIDPYPYYEEVLNRDSLDVRVNTQLGILYCKRGMFREAEEKLKTAIERITKNYTRPKDGEALYYLGMALSAQEKYKEAYDAFYGATWSFAWHAAAYYKLAEIESINGEFEIAIEHLDQSLSANSFNTKAWNLKSAILRKLGRYQEAELIVQQVLVMDPLDFWAHNEMALTFTAQDKKDKAAETLFDLKTIMNNDAELYLELSVDYANAGLWNEAIDVLLRVDRTMRVTGSTYPMIYYYLGYYWNKAESPPKAQLYYRLANEMPPDYCFSYRWESIHVLRDAIQTNPADAKAPYYLGNLLYDLQPENAIKAWEQSRKLDDTFSLVHRNLGFAYAKIKNDVSKAIASLETAIKYNKKDPRLFYELDVLSQAGGQSPQKRLKLLQKNHKTVVKRDDALSREVALLVQTGQYDKAIKYLTTHHFNTWEGGGNIHDIYVDAFLLRGLDFFSKKNYTKALSDFQGALKYPRNLEVGRPINDPQACRT